MVLNGKREIPYDFKVFEMDGWVWLFDDSERQYPCTSQAHIYAEPVYCLSPYGDEEDGVQEYPEYPDSILMVSLPEPALPVMTLPLDTPEQEAWDEAREEANANHRI